MNDFISVTYSDPGCYAFLTPGGMGKKSGSGSRIRNEQPGSYFLELRNYFLGFKYLSSVIQIRNGKNSDPGWKKVGSEIRDPGSGKTSRIRNTAIYYITIFV
jgi:hypothetical protein